MNGFVLDGSRPPILVGAGVAKEFEVIKKFAVEEAIAATTMGSYSYEENVPSSGQDFYYDPITKAAYNTIRLRNPGSKKASEYLPEAIKMMHDIGQIAIISIVALKNDDPHTMLPIMAEWALEQGADAVEMDTSCKSHNPDKPLLCESHDELAAVVSAVRLQIGHDSRLGVKFGPLSIHDVSQYSQMNLPMDFVTTINSLGHQPVPLNPDTNKPYIEINDGRAGMSGPAICDLARQNAEYWLGWIDGYSTEPEPVNYQVLSLGGVTSGHEVYDRVHNMKATMAGGVQELYRHPEDPRRAANRWAQEYVEAA